MAERGSGHNEVSEDRLRQALLARCRAGHIEPPADRADHRRRKVCGHNASVPPLCPGSGRRGRRLEQLVADDDENTEGHGVLAELKPARTISWTAS